MCEKNAGLQTASCILRVIFKLDFGTVSHSISQMCVRYKGIYTL